MQLHYHVLKDTCFGIYFQDAFACYGHGSSELIILNHPFQKYSWHGADSAFMCWIVIVANRSIWTVVALNRNMVSIWACIVYSFHLKYKIEYAVLFFIRKKEKKKAADLSPLSSVSGLSGHSLCIKSQPVMDIVISITL